VSAAELVAKGADGYTPARCNDDLRDASRSLEAATMSNALRACHAACMAANVVAAGASVKSIGELVAWRSKPLLYGLQNGTPRIAGEMMNLLTGNDDRARAVQRAGPALIDVILGQIHSSSLAHCGGSAA
jgi:hypothetical protein